MPVAITSDPSSEVTDVDVGTELSSSEAVALAFVMVVLVRSVLDVVAVAVLKASWELVATDDDEVEEVMAPFTGGCGWLDEVLVVVSSLVVRTVVVEDIEGVIVAASAELVSDDEITWGATTVEATGKLVTASVVSCARVLIGAAEVVDVSTVLVVDSEVVSVSAAVVGTGVVISVVVSAESVVTANVECVVEVLVEVKVEVEVTAVARMLAAAESASSMSSSETGFSSSLQPVCMGSRRSKTTFESPSEQTDIMHSSTVSSRPFLEATHISFWSSSLSVVYPVCCMQS